MMSSFEYESDGEFVEPFLAACIQNRPRILDNLDDKDQVIGSNIDRLLTLIDYATDWGHSNVRLVVCPEYAINGPRRPIPHDVETLIATAIPLTSRHVARLADKARQRNIYLAANVLEVDPDWPGRFFNTTFLLNPRGEIVLRHWKNNHNASHNPYTTPADVYDEYVAKYGRKQLFPVVKTELGNIGAITCCECYFAELVRCTVFNGAEIILGPTASNLYPSDKYKIGMIQGHCNAMGIYWVRANLGGYVDSVVPSENYVGDSVIINYTGDRMVQIAGNGEGTCRARLDVNALREHRPNQITWGTFRAEMIAREYMEVPSWPSNGFAQRPIASLEETKGVKRQVVDAMYEQGVLSRPFKPRRKRQEDNGTQNPANEGLPALAGGAEDIHSQPRMSD
ncbi:MAG: hypothetical protein JOZ39_07920 [Chloroflexi bacterium]|nr:hypothetical protein [Chloroflexota bacterium]